MKDIFDVANKVVVVTGSGRGNGKAIAMGFLERGSQVCSIDLSFEDISENNNHYALEFDLQLVTGIPGLVKDLYSRYGSIDVLINNAGISLSGENPYTVEVLEKTLSINLKSAYVLSHQVGMLMSKKKMGSIINITSLGAEIGFSNNPSYQVSKAALKQ